MMSVVVIPAVLTVLVLAATLIAIVLLIKYVN